MVDEDKSGRWARLRFLVVGPLLANPPPRGKLQSALRRLSKQKWRHPITGEITTFGVSTIERWYYRANCDNDPVSALRRQVRFDAGNNRALTGQLLTKLEHQYRQHPSWSYQLHADNLVALAEEKPSLGTAPSYSTVRRGMKKRGWLKRPRQGTTAGQRRAQERLENREVRSYEASYSHALWHIDGHKSNRKIIDSNGIWYQPTCICILDDFSRLGCHAQWYSSESSEAVNHTFIQAFLKRGLPRGNLSDNGGGMTAEEITNGLSELGISPETTLEHSPYQNGKQESFWGQIEGRLMPMLESVQPLTLEFLNRATQAWLEQEYNRSRHDEIGMSPLERMLQGPDVSRPAPSFDELCFHFTVIQKRRQRRSDGTISIAGLRFELPSRFRHQEEFWVRYARWNFNQAYLVDPRHHSNILAKIFPLDKRKNADRRRRLIDPTTPVIPEQPTEPIPPLMRRLLANYSACGLPPAYLPLENTDIEEKDDENDDR